MPSVDVVEFAWGEEGALAEVVAAMQTLVEARSGWLTLDPAVPDDLGIDLRPSPLRIFGNRGPLVPRGTWVPADVARRSPEPVSVGILHGSGQRAAAQLAEAGLAVPDRWKVVQDHPKRGLVAYVPVDVAHEEVLGWLLAASRRLSRVPLTGRWRAAVHRT